MHVTLNVRFSEAYRNVATRIVFYSFFRTQGHTDLLSWEKRENASQVASFRGYSLDAFKFSCWGYPTQFKSLNN